MKPFTHLKFLSVTIGTGLIVITAGCNRDGIKVYHVDTNDLASAVPPPLAAPASPGGMPATMPAGLPTPDKSGLPQLQYTVPAGWEQKTPTTMRVASFGITQGDKQVDISVIPLGGMAGSDPANVNRWRGQVGLAPLADNDLAGLAEKVSVGDQPADLFDLVGTATGGSAAERIIGVILHRDDTSWFFKMTGDAALVEQAKPAFIAFLKSVSFGPPAAAPAVMSGMDMSQLPPSHPPIGGMNATPSAAADLPTWTVPADWQPAPLEQFLVAKYVISGPGGEQAAVNVSSLGGDGGGLLPNVNRWRGQLGLAPVTDADVAKLPAIDTGARLTSIVCYAQSH